MFVRGGNTKKEALESIINLLDHAIKEPKNDEEIKRTRFFIDAKNLAGTILELLETSE